VPSLNLRKQFERLADHPWLVGDPDEPGEKVARRARWMTAVGIVQANAIGALVVVVFAVFALPKPALHDDAHVTLINTIAAAIYVVIALPVGVVWGRRRLEGGEHGVRDWLEDEREPDDDERFLVLRAPLRIMTVQAVLWGCAVVLFTVLNLQFSGLLALGVGTTVALGGLTTSAAAYLLCELAFRPIASRALAHHDVDRKGVPGVATRWLLAWAVGTGVPILGLLMVGIVALTSVQISENVLAVTIIALCGIGLTFGAIVSVLAAYATVHPIRSIRRGLRSVREGDLDVEVGVWDSTEMGLLQAGFNDMVSGLQEREKVRDLFGRQVGEDVARQALDDEIRLGGEVREVTVMFVDLVGSTELAAENDPEEVVELLNRFFAEVVEVVEGCGGWINKFEGDAALAIYGAPVPVDDDAGKALRAARVLQERLEDKVGELTAAIGVARGEAVAGNIGAETRFEYTVIGDPVNEASRLTDLAKDYEGRVLASADVVEAVEGDEADNWELGDEVTLRGRNEPTKLAYPRGGGGKREDAEGAQDPA
jgi:adenylate cyclase